jgi:hypothetical protein
MKLERGQRPDCMKLCPLFVGKSKFFVPTEVLKRGDNSLAISVNWKGLFQASKAVKIELHLK